MENLEDKGRSLLVGTLLLLVLFQAIVSGMASFLSPAVAAGPFLVVLIWAAAGALAFRGSRIARWVLVVALAIAAAATLAFALSHQASPTARLFLLAFGLAYAGFLLPLALSKSITAFQTAQRSSARSPQS